MLKLLFIGLMILSSNVTYAACVPAKEIVVVRHSGMYHRIHPSGNYFLYTDESKAKIVDIANRKNPKIIKMALALESYPVESASGGLSMIASPMNEGSGGMHFLNSQI